MENDLNNNAQPPPLIIQNLDTLSNKEESNHFLPTPKSFSSSSSSSQSQKKLSAGDLSNSQSRSSDYSDFEIKVTNVDNLLMLNKIASKANQDEEQFFNEGVSLQNSEKDQFGDEQQVLIVQSPNGEMPIKMNSQPI